MFYLGIFHNSMKKPLLFSTGYQNFTKLFRRGYGSEIYHREKYQIPTFKKESYLPLIPGPTLKYSL